MDDTEMPEPNAHSEAQEAPKSGSAEIVVASFASRRGAERMVASLGHSFRHKARNGIVNAFVVTRSNDGTFKIFQSRVITATGVVFTTTFFAAEIMVGLVGIGAMRKGAKGASTGRTRNNLAWERMLRTRRALRPRFGGGRFA